MGELLVREAGAADLPAIIRMLAADAIRVGNVGADDYPADGEPLAQEYVAAFEEIHLGMKLNLQEAGA